MCVYSRNPPGIFDQHHKHRRLLFLEAMGYNLLYSISHSNIEGNSVHIQSHRRVQRSRIIVCIWRKLYLFFFFLSHTAQCAFSKQLCGSYQLPSYTVYDVSTNVTSAHMDSGDNWILQPVLRPESMFQPYFSVFITVKLHQREKLLKTKPNCRF